MGIKKALNYTIISSLCVLCLGRDEKWVWGDNSRGPKTQSRLNPDLGASARYEVFENSHYQPEPPPYRPNFTPLHHTGAGIYGPTHNYREPINTPDILTGPVPSWVKEGPVKNYDKCKCTQKFNCNTPGISYGHCDVGKQYCCYSSRNQLGGPLPARNEYSPEHGVLVGPGGSDRLIGGGGGFGLGRPAGGGYGLLGRPGRPDQFSGGQGGFGLGGSGDVLVGPGFGGYGRAAKVDKSV